jgi:SagB-type dehydrogenase family enzyme
MKRVLFLIIVILIISGCSEERREVRGGEIGLPKPRLDSDFSIEKALLERSSVRSFKSEALSLEEVSQLLWAAQGIDGVTGATRRAPSAGATHPLEVYLVVKDVNGLGKGVYHYNPKKHAIEMVSNKDVKSPYDAPVFVVLTAVYERTTQKYGTRGVRYVNIEVGHVGQNIHLQALSLGLGSFPTGAFDDEEVKNMLGIEEEPLYVISIGKV